MLVFALLHRIHYFYDDEIFFLVLSSQLMPENEETVKTATKHWSISLLVVIQHRTYIVNPKFLICLSNC